ncbi:DUF4258 domain-containing protein [Picosynechococcus sp. NKBG042902]|uniref:DUF4258 domain-containing protein n=1 Tax=Picosynechococcus sp. NKBG042902 TaxID=490193 RepID=UPI0028F41088|nr:DUF4258 domain-containing protein [Picosynechococcus sp. NKBG042902]
MMSRRRLPTAKGLMTKLEAVLFFRFCIPRNDKNRRLRGISPMANPLNGYVLSIHAQEVLQRSERQTIEPEWIQRALDNPDYSDWDDRTNAVRVWKRIPEYGDRALRVVYNPDKQPPVIVTVFFDRSFKG